MSHIITKTDLDDSINANIDNAAMSYVTKKYVIFIFHVLTNL